MPVITDDDMLAAAGVTLNGRAASDVGGPWVRHPLTTSTATWRSTGTRFYPNALGTGLKPSVIYANDTPGTAEYDVEVDYRHIDNYGNAGIVGRWSAYANSGYFGYHGAGAGATPQFVLIKSVAGLLTTLDFLNESLAVGEGRLKLEIRDATKRLYYDDGGGYDLKCESTDNQITVAGFGGLRSAFQFGDAEGKQFRNFTITDLSSPAARPQLLMIGD